MFQLDFADSADFMEYRIVKIDSGEIYASNKKKRFNGFPFTRSLVNLLTCSPVNPLTR